MDENKQKLITFMQSGYAITKWPYFSIVDLQNLIGSDTMEALLQLASEDKVKFRIGVHGQLIEYIPQEK